MNEYGGVKKKFGILLLVKAWIIKIPLADQ